MVTTIELLYTAAAAFLFCPQGRQEQWNGITSTKRRTSRSSLRQQIPALIRFLLSPTPNWIRRMIRRESKCSRNNRPRINPRLPYKYGTIHPGLRLDINVMQKPA